MAVSVESSKSALLLCLRPVFRVHIKGSGDCKPRCTAAPLAARHSSAAQRRSGRLRITQINRNDRQASRSGRGAPRVKGGVACVSRRRQAVHPLLSTLYTRLAQPTDGNQDSVAVSSGSRPSASSPARLVRTQGGGAEETSPPLSYS